MPIPVGRALATRSTTTSGQCARRMTSFEALLVRLSDGPLPAWSFDNGVSIDVWGVFENCETDLERGVIAFWVDAANGDYIEHEVSSLSELQSFLKARG